MYIFQKEILEG